MQYSERAVARELPRLFTEWMGEGTDLRVESPKGSTSGRVDLLVSYQGLKLAIEVLASDEVGRLDAAMERLRRLAPGDATQVLAVPYMGPKAQAFARERHSSWLDLSGNVDLRAPGLRIRVDGRPNRFASPGRPSTAFSPKASRIARALLAYPGNTWRQHELASYTGLSSGYVSKVVARLTEDDLLDARPDGSVVAKSASVLLDAWAQVYRFERHTLAQHHAIGRSGPEVAHRVGAALKRLAPGEWACTGLAAAWCMQPFAEHRLSTFYVEHMPEMPEDFGLRPVSKGGNVWLVVPNDRGVFSGTKTFDGLCCVTAAQVYLDLAAHPERSDEAAAHLRPLAIGTTAQ
jgi:hypothetical protein